MLVGGVPVDERLLRELARVVPPTLGRRMDTALFYRAKVLGLTVDERKAILAALEDPPAGLEELRALLLENRLGVGQERGHTQTGQASGEYAIVLGAIAFVCVLAALFVGLGVRGQFQSGGEEVQQAPFQPPIASSEPSWPVTLAECEDGGWQDFPQFADEAECREYVEGLTR